MSEQDMGAQEAEPSAGPLNPDAYAFMVLQREYREQMDRHKRLRECERDIRADLERTVADALTAADRATSIMKTLLKLEPTRWILPLQGNTQGKANG